MTKNEQLLREAQSLADSLDSEFVTGRTSNHIGRKAASMLRQLCAALTHSAEGGDGLLSLTTCREVCEKHQERKEDSQGDGYYVMNEVAKSIFCELTKRANPTPSSQEQAQQPQFVRVVDGVPVITVTEHEHLMAQQPKPQPMTDEVFDLICKAIDKADTITMEGDYMLDSDDCIAVVRVMQVLLSIRHGITSDKEPKQ